MDLDQAKERILPAMPGWKFYFLMFITCGLYQITWLFRNWKYFQPEANAVWKTILCIIPFVGIWFTYKQLAAIKAVAEQNGVTAKYDPTARTIGWVVCVGLANRGIGIDKPDLAIPGLVFYVVLFMLAISLLWKVEKSINDLYRAKTGGAEITAAFSPGEIVWTVLGLICTGLVACAVFLPG